MRKSSMLHSLLPAAALAAGLLPQAHAEAPVDTAVFIGERLSIEPYTHPCTQEPMDSERGCILMDALFTARYRIVQPIVGTPAGDTLEFRVADHYGYPPFARFEHALLFVAMDAPPYLHKYQAVPVHRTVDGQWAACGDIRTDPDASESPEVRPLGFSQPIARWADLPELTQQSYRDGDKPHWRVSRGEVRCTAGIPVEDVYRMVLGSGMRTRGASLPAWPETDAGR